jgi:hypothetical protein
MSGGAAASETGGRPAPAAMGGWKMETGNVFQDFKPRSLGSKAQDVSHGIIRIPYPTNCPYFAFGACQLCGMG